MCSTTIAPTSDHESRTTLAELEKRDADIESLPSIKNGELSRFLDMHGWESELEQSLGRSRQRHDELRSKSPRKHAEVILTCVPRETIHVTSFNPALPPHPPAGVARPRVCRGAIHSPRTLPKACTSTASREKLRMQSGSSSARAAASSLISPRRLARLDYPHSAREGPHSLAEQPFRHSPPLHLSPQKTIRPLNGLSVQNSLNHGARMAPQSNRPCARSPSPPRAPSPTKDSDIFAQLLMQHAEEEAAETTAATNSDHSSASSAVDHTKQTMAASPRRDIGSVMALTPVQRTVPTQSSIARQPQPCGPDDASRPVTAEASLRVPLAGDTYHVVQSMHSSRRLPLEVRGGVHARWRVEVATPAATKADVARRPHTVSGNRLRIPRPRTFRCSGPPYSARSAQFGIRAAGGRCGQSVCHESDSVFSEDGGADTSLPSCSRAAQPGVECGAECEQPCSPRRQSSSAAVQNAQHASSMSDASRAPCTVETDHARQGLPASNSSPSRSVSSSPPSRTRSGSRKNLHRSALQSSHSSGHRSGHKSDRGHVAARWHEAVLALRRAELTPQFGIPYVALDAPPTPRDGPPSRITTWLAEEDEVEEAPDPADKVLSLGRAISREVLSLKLDELEDAWRMHVLRPILGEDKFTTGESDEKGASRHDKKGDTSGRGTPWLQRRDTSSGRTTPHTQA